MRSSNRRSGLRLPTPRPRRAGVQTTCKVKPSNSRTRGSYRGAYDFAEPGNAPGQKHKIGDQAFRVSRHRAV